MYFAGAQIAATVLTGRQVDQGALRGPLAISCLVLISGPVSLVLPLPDALRIALCGCGLGYATGASAVAGGALWPAYFGLATIGRLRAFTSGIRNAATAGAPLMVAVFVQRSDPGGAGLVLAAISAMALLLALALLHPPGTVVRNQPLETSSNA